MTRVVDRWKEQQLVIGPAEAVAVAGLVLARRMGQTKHDDHVEERGRDMLARCSEAAQGRGASVALALGSAGVVELAVVRDEHHGRQIALAAGLVG